MVGIISTPVFAASQPDETVDLLLRGAKQWDAKNRPDRAKNLLRKAILIEPNSIEGLYLLGDLELKSGELAEARRHLNILEQTAPDHPRTLKLAGLYRLKTGPAPLPETAQKSVTTVQPASSAKTTRATTGPDKATASIRKETSSVIAKQTATPKKISKTVSKVAVKPPKPENDASMALDPDIIARSDALDALGDGNPELAETSLLDILKRRPHDPEVLGGLGSVKQYQDQPAEAKKWFEMALQEAQAAHLESDIIDRWQSLVTMSKFWESIGNAKDLLEEKKLPEAEAAATEAIALQPKNPHGLAVMGNIKAAGNDHVEAERLYREALEIEPHNVLALLGLSDLLQKNQRSDEALALIENILRTRTNWYKDVGSKARLLREEANLYLEAHRPSLALKALETAVSTNPKDPWIRFSLAKLYISLDLTPLARRVLQEGIALAPTDPAMHQVNALVMMTIDDYAAAIDSLNQIPEESLTQDMRNTKNRALMKYYMQQVDNKITQGNRKEAMRIMSVAEIQARGDFSATEQVAEGWFRLDQQKLGLAAMRKLPQPAPLATQVRFASLLNRAKKDQELTDYLPTLRIPQGPDETNKHYRDTIQDIEFAMAGRQYDKLMKAGKKEEAQQFSENILDANQLSSSDYFRFHRSYFSTAKLPENALLQLNQEKEQNPDDLNMRWELAYAYYQNKQNSEAQRELQEMLALTKSDDIDMRLRIARLEQNTGNSAAAKRILDDLIERYPNNTEVTLQAGNIARSEGHYNQAMSYYEQTRERSGNLPIAQTPNAPTASTQQPVGLLLNLLPDTPGKSGTTKRIAPTLASTSESEGIYRSALTSDVPQQKPVGNSDAANAQLQMDSISARRTFTIEAGADIQRKSATNGLSTYNATEIPLVAHFPIGYEAKGIVQVDKINLDAGALAPADAKSFGMVQAYNYTLAQPLPQQASGTSLAVGYEQGSVKADIGVAGQGFLVSNVVGGIRKGGSIGQLSYSLNLSRRPYTGSIISYAGAKDPVTGVVWGGVTQTGLSLYMSTTLSTTMLGDFNVSGITSYGLLRGQNVLNNDRLFLRAAIDKDVYASEDMVLNVGFGINYTGFSKNEAYYTFGHGGYYSPQSSLSFGLPIELAGRADLLSYQIRASVSYARTNTDPAAYHPTDPTLQNLAAAAGTAIYSGGPGSGFGYGLRGTTEYRATPNFALGGRFNMDRSAYYAPNSVLFYLRYMFNPETGPVKLRPDPVTPYSQY
jgi:predicted Zn-dependent protease